MRDEALNLDLSNLRWTPKPVAEKAPIPSDGQHQQKRGSRRIQFKGGAMKEVESIRS